MNDDERKILFGALLTGLCDAIGSEHGYVPQFRAETLQKLHSFLAVLIRDLSVGCWRPAAAAAVLEKVTTLILRAAAPAAKSWPTAQREELRIEIESLIDEVQISFGYTVHQAVRRAMRFVGLAEQTS